MSSTDRAAAVIRRVLSPGEPSNRLLRFGLGALALAGSLTVLGVLAGGLPWWVDLVIPIQAAGRWLAGGQAYVPETFANGPGYDLPFLYPPYALPLFAALRVIPLQALPVAWFAAGLVVAVATCRRLGFRLRWIPLVLVWPPFAEGLIVGNVQIAIFAAFVFLLDDAGPMPRRPGPPLVRGLLGAATAFLKVTQPHVVVHLLRHDRRAAIVAILAIMSLVLSTLPLTGAAIWLDWMDQLRRAADPAWIMGGPAVGRLLPSPIGLLIVVTCIAAVLAVPRVQAAAWVGVLLVLGAPALHTYYLLFLLPAMLRIRREIAFVAALLVTTYTELGWWFAIAMVAGALALSRRYSALSEPLERPPLARGSSPAQAG